MIIKAYTFATHPHGRRGFENLKPEHREWDCSSFLIYDNGDFSEVLEELMRVDPEGKDWVYPGIARACPYTCPETGELRYHVGLCARPGSECATVLADADHWIERHGHGRIASDAARARALETAA